MGNDPVKPELIAEQERGIEALRNLPQEAKEYLCHHIFNALAPVVGYTEMMLEQQKPLSLEYIRYIKEGVDHALADLRRIGC